MFVMRPDCTVQATGRKPAWETGASMALPRKATAAKPQSAAPAKSAWSLAPDDEDVELLDDSELLTEEDLQRPSVPCKLLTLPISDADICSLHSLCRLSPGACHTDERRSRDGREVRRVSVLWCAAVGDCSTGATKKACANCTCGRAEEEAQGIKASLTADMLDNPQSACGSVSFFL